MDTTMATMRQQHWDIMACLRAMMIQLEIRRDTCDLRAFLTYFEWDVTDHFAFQEGTVFPLLAEDASIAAGPLRMMASERAAFQGLLTGLRETLASDGRERQLAATADIIDLLLLHLTKQEVSWFPMVSRVLSRNGRGESGLAHQSAEDPVADGNGAVERHLRWLAADQLGVDLEELTPETSLVDDLGADTLDLLEIAQAIETELGVPVPDGEIDRVRTYADLVSLIMRLASAGQRAAVVPSSPGLVRARVVPAETAGDALVLRAAPLTPHLERTIIEDALRVDGGARVEISVPPETSDAEIARVAGHLAWLAERDVQVSIQRAQSTGLSVDTNHCPNPGSPAAEREKGDLST